LRGRTCAWKVSGEGEENSSDEIGTLRPNVIIAQVVTAVVLELDLRGAKFEPENRPQ
jgi:hypothetical protein